jgi:hypothetical protein
LFCRHQTEFYGQDDNFQLDLVQFISLLEIELLRTVILRIIIHHHYKSNYNTNVAFEELDDSAASELSVRSPKLSNVRKDQSSDG